VAGVTYAGSDKPQLTSHAPMAPHSLHWGQMQGGCYAVHNRGGDARAQARELLVRVRDAEHARLVKGARHDLRARGGAGSRSASREALATCWRTPFLHSTHTGVLQVYIYHHASSRSNRKL